MFSMQQAIRSIVVGAVLARERWQSAVAYNPLSRSPQPSHRLPGDGCGSPYPYPVRASPRQGKEVRVNG